MLSGTNFWRTLMTTTWFAVISVALEMLIGVLAALLLNQRFHGRGLLRALLILPWALPTVVNATLWRLIYNPEYGALNAALTQTGLMGAPRFKIARTAERHQQRTHADGMQEGVIVLSLNPQQAHQCAGITQNGFSDILHHRRHLIEFHRLAQPGILHHRAHQRGSLMTDLHGA
eukprot:gene47651-64612_t